MDDETLKRVLADLNDQRAPEFDQILAGRTRRRPRRLPIAAGLLLVAGVAAAPLIFQPPTPEPEISLPAPPTTDWLLQTPDPAWVAHLDPHANEETSHAH
jgi:hypothetical protein